MRITMLRHGRTAWNAERRIQGRTDIPLSDTGRQALEGLRLAPAQDAEVWISSPLTRATETARILSGSRPHTTDARLMEMNFGDWEGHTHADLIAADPAGMRRSEARGIHMRPPGGETPAEVATRLLDFLSSREESALVLVSHKGVIRAALARASGWDMTSDPPFAIKWHMAQTFLFDDGRLRIDRLNIPLVAA
ncbi:MULTISPECIES: histidine phosphatase family protein [unclassified Minwuia]|jgi:broad specificity phosphatase PhoE|uniref:histidine phosphatase family protein n=1 Tax=unclassified Minwuia TaxID=2618799 RepID=UPI0024797175|nr:MULTISPECIES: histidine phosphatase family protein [unclassified Minwuia]